MNLNKSPFLDRMRGLVKMAMQPLILARRDAACGKVFTAIVAPPRSTVSPWKSGTEPLAVAEKIADSLSFTANDAAAFIWVRNGSIILAITKNLGTHNPSNSLKHAVIHDLTV